MKSIKAILLLIISGLIMSCNSNPSSIDYKEPQWETIEVIDILSTNGTYFEFDYKSRLYPRDSIKVTLDVYDITGVDTVGFAMGWNIDKSLNIVKRNSHEFPYTQVFKRKVKDGLRYPFASMFFLDVIDKNNGIERIEFTLKIERKSNKQ